MWLSVFKSYLGAHILPTALLFAAALVGLYCVEGYPLAWRSLRERFRYPLLRFKDVLWALVVLVALMVGWGRQALSEGIPGICRARSPDTLTGGCRF